MPNSVGSEMTEFLKDNFSKQGVAWYKSLIIEQLCLVMYDHGIHMTRIKSIINEPRCRDSRSAKGIENKVRMKA